MFQNLATGYDLGSSSGVGTEGQQFLRCRFLNCSYAGAVTSDFNSLNNFFLYCLFQNCQYGLLNGAGNFHVAHCVFLNNTYYDIGISNPDVFYVYDNVSVGSLFFLGSGTSGNVLLQGNAVYNTGDPGAVNVEKNVVLLDNLIKSAPGNAGPALLGRHTPSILSLGNRYTVASPVGPNYGDLSHYHSIDDTVVNPATVPTPTTLSLPGTPPNRGRKVFEVAPGTGDDAGAIQTQINAAAGQPFGTRPVVHLAKGLYSISRTLTVPASADVQLLGDTETGTSLEWDGPAGGTLLQLLGPGRATVAELYLKGDANLILATNADQPGGRIYADQVLLGAANGRHYPPRLGIYVNGVEQSNVTLLGTGGGDCDRSILVTGGPLLAAGRTTGGQVLDMLGGGGASHTAFYDVNNGGRMVAIGKYDEEDGGVDHILTLGATTGSLTLAANIMNCESAQTTPTYTVNGFKGDLNYILNSSNTPNYKGEDQNGLVPWWQLTGSGRGLNDLVWGSSFSPGNDPSVTAAYEWRDTTSPAAQSAFIKADVGTYGDMPLSDVTNQVVGAEPSDQFYRNRLAPLRAIHLDVPTVLPGGVTDLRFDRIFAQGKMGRTLMELRGANVAAFKGPHSLPGTVECEDYDLNGEGVGYHQTASGGQTGYRTDNDSALYTDAAASNGHALGWTGSRQWTRYSVVAQTGGVYTVAFRVASATGGGTFHLEDASGNNLTGKVTTPATSGGSTYATVSAALTLPAGPQVLKLVQDTGGYNLDSLTFTVKSAAETVLTTQTPAATGSNDGVAYELGMKFQSRVAGNVTALRFWKDVADTDSHTGNLWDSQGHLLASAAFTGGTVSGWQQVALSSPVAIAANTKYTVSVNTSGYYVDTPAGLESRITNMDLSSIADGANGVSGTKPGAFPTSSDNNPNYFRDVVFTPTSSQGVIAAPAGLRARGSSGQVRLTWSAVAGAATYSVYRGTTAGGEGTTAVKTGLTTLNWTEAGRTNGTTYYYVVRAVNASSTSGASNEASARPAALLSVFTTQTPAVTNANNGVPYEMGMKFKAKSAGRVTSLRFWKVILDTGAHVGHLWTASGTLLATVTFGAETASGWQLAALSSPVPLAAGQVYVVSVSTTGYYPFTGGGLASVVSNGLLSSVADGANGVYGNSGTFPTSSYENANYFRDIVFQPN